MSYLLVFFPFLVVAAVAQWSERHRWARGLTYGLILALDAGVALGGLAALGIALDAGLQERLRASSGLARADWWGVGLMWIVSALLSPLPLVPGVRRALSRLIPIDAGSPIHATALALAILMLGLNLSQVPLIGGLGTLAASPNQFRFQDVMAPSVPVGIFALVGVGLWVRRTPRQAWRRLGLGGITWRQVGLVIALAVAILGFYYGVDWLWRWADPEGYGRMEALGEVLYGGFAWYESVVISLTVAVTEELLFRGALQPRLGFLLTALLFTGAHVQYGLSPAVLEVLGGALALGWLRRRINTSACVLLHALYDLGALLVFPWLP